MNENLQNKLQKLGFRDSSLESLFDALPKNIWVTLSKKNMKRQAVFYMLQITNKKQTLFLLTEDPDEGEVVLNKEAGSSTREVLAKMLIFLHQSELIDDSIE